MNQNRVLIDIEDHVATVTLNRADKLNALDEAMFKAIINAADEIQANPSVRVVVLHGNGKGFCAGLDLSMFTTPNEMMETPLSERTHGMVNTWQAVAYKWRSIDIPVIAAIHGVAFGGGLQIMSGADIKYIHPDTRLSIMEMKWGLIPDMAGSQLWRHNVREDIVKELTYTHRVFSGQEAVSYGFATHASENPLEDALKLAKEISAKSPSAMVEAKRLFNTAPYLNEKDGYMLESELQDRVMKKPNQLEAVYSGMQKRPGNFQDYRSK